MAKLILEDITSGYNTAVRYNSNNDLIEEAIENTLSLDGNSPNVMQVDFDMGGNKIVNLGAPTLATDAVRVQDLQDGTVTISPDIAWADVQSVPGTLLDIGNLINPGADRILFWDNSIGEITYLTAGTGLSIAGTTISATVSSVAYANITGVPAYVTSLGLLADPNADRLLFWDDSATNIAHLTVGTGLNLTTTTLSFNHLGFQSLTDPGLDRVLFWDDSAGSTQWLAVGSGLSISGTTLSADAAAAYVTSLGLLTDPGADRIIFWDDSATNLGQLQLGTYLAITDTTIDMASVTGTYTGTLTGVTSGSGTVKYSVTGNQVTVEVPDITGTANSTAHTITGGPVAIRPATAQTVVGSVVTVNNTVDAIGSLVVGTDGTFTLRNVLNPVFAGTGTEGIKNCTFTYHKS